MTSFVFTQPFNNSWINYSQQYYKFKIAETGIYRIDSTVLANAGIPLSSINPQNFQLFARGVEIPLYIEGEVDGVFNGSDFIEFYGQKNDGWLDEQLYGSATNHPNPYYSLFNDTISYFLTWNASITNNRLVLETDTNFSAYTSINSFFKENIDEYSSGSKKSNDPYYDGKTLNVGGSAVTLFGYSPTEGWFDNPYILGGNKTKNVATRNADLTGVNATLDAVVISWSDFAGISNGDHHLRLSIGSNVFDTIFEGHQKIDVQMSIPITDIGVVNTGVNFASINDLGSSVSKQTVAYIRLKYPHTMDLEGSLNFDGIFLDDHPTQSKSLFNFSNFSPTGNVLFYDLTNSKRIQVEPVGANYQCLVPNTGSQKECYVSSDGQLRNILSLTAINSSSTPGFFANYGLNPPDTAFLIITHPSLMNGANDYATYRLNPAPSSVNIDPQNAVVYDIEDLYDQFAFGIEKNPLAIRGFVDYILNTWSTEPNYLFLIGKSIKSKENRRSLTNYNNNLVPSYGVPASDNMLTAGLNGTFFEPAIPTGRLAANNNTEIAWYLEKVEDHEDPVLGINGETEWMKRVLHFGGGTTASEQQGFVNNLNSFKTIIEDTMFGGAVNSYFKNSTAPIVTSLSDSIKDFIGDGVALMTFLGHASTSGGFDQNIDNPNLWPNPQGRYPLLIGLACFAGDIHTETFISTSEEHVLIEDKGVIGFLSSVDLSLSSTLGVYANSFYSNMSYFNYGKSIGRHIKSTIEQTQVVSSGVENFTNSTALNVTFHGDPSIRLNTFPQPDYMIEASTITYSPSIVTSDIDSFDVNVLVTNLGKAVNDTISLEIVRDYPGQSFTDTSYVSVFSGTNYQETISIRMPVDVVRGLGMNTFTITVDAPLPGFVLEISENNNQVIKTLNILSGELVPIYPYEFMIVPDSIQNTTLKASTAFPFEPAKNYIFEIDTTDLFDSPIKQATTINASGGVITWTPTIYLPQDSVVYFWRVSKDSVDATGFSWRLRSFQRIKGKEGWQQDHFFQFENNGMQFVDYNRPSRKFNFVNDIKDLKVNNQGDANSSEYNLINYIINGVVQGQNAYGSPASIHVAVLDSVTLIPWRSDIRNSGQVNSPAMPTSGSYRNYFVFHHNATSMAALESFIKDTVPSGNHIAMWSTYIATRCCFNDSMPASLRAEFVNMGAPQLSTIPNLYPFILYHQKGNISSTIEVVGDSIPQRNLSLSKSLTTSANFGNVFSPILGPAVSWDSLSWRMTTLESPSTRDSSVLNVIGVDASGNETPLLTINPLPTDSGDISISSRVDAAIYPYLKLNTYLADDSLQTAPQLDRWQITYEGAPEAALDPNINFTFQNDTVDEGVNIIVSIAIKNISRYDMDSLLISFVVLDKNNNLQFLPYPRQKPLLSDSVLIAFLSFSTVGMRGLNSLLIDVNPNNDQLEQYHFNNVAQIPFYVNSDKINPILDVTFDGIHILDGDIVSPKANIVIELTDENQFLLLNDTSDYAVYITSPFGSEERLYFNGGGVERMQFIPASLPKNNSKIIMQGNFLQDGEYRLRVQASDRTKNNSGSFDYIINFEVINKSTITNILNYPNPFTTSTRFVFTITGSEIPDIFKIQIMTITGKVVREIHKDELGAINIGRNISDFAWDGTDTYGDRLANGLYLYRVITKINSEDIEHRDTSADWYFKKGFGKMYLFR